jgi:mannose-1-phosphate guanylyltransferase
MSESHHGKGMRALILVGGFGTRLRPLTLTMPKPLVPFCNKPMIIHQVEALKEAGVTDIILAVAYRPEAMKAEMEEWGRVIGVTFIFSHETEPLGTAGPLALARDELLKDDQPFFVLNSDVTCKFPLKELLAFHRKHGHEGTIMVTKVQEWHKYGVVVYDETSGLIDQFVEKPKKFVGDKINSGIYCFNKSILNRIKLEKTSIETQVFPQMASSKELYCMELEGFWMDIGQPHDYIDGIAKYLPSILGTPKESESLFNEQTAKDLHFSVVGCVMIDPSAEIGAGCVLGPNVTVGKNCKIGPSCRILNSAIFENTVIGAGTYISKTIIGWNNIIGRWCRIENNAVFGDDVQVKPELYLNGVKVLPNKGISTSYDKPEILM